MKRLSLVVILGLCSAMCAITAFAQDADVSSGGTVRGQIVDTTTAQAPVTGVQVVVKDVSGSESKAETDSSGEYEISNLPAGRYLISIYKDGYGDRVGKPVTVVSGGDHYVPLKMTKKDNIVSFFNSFGNYTQLKSFPLIVHYDHNIPEEVIHVYLVVCLSFPDIDLMHQ